MPTSTAKPARKPSAARAAASRQQGPRSANVPKAKASKTKAPKTKAPKATIIKASAPKAAAPTSAASRPKGKVGVKKALHPRNAHVNGYDFPALIAAYPELKLWVRPTPYGELSIDFADAKAVKALNAALLKHHYGVVHWDIPKGALCPPIPGRVDYLHYLADLLGEGDELLTPTRVNVLDIGTGANGIYPILGSRVYGWQFVAADINRESLANVAQIIERNPLLQGQINLRHQQDERSIFNGIIQPNEHFALTLCNPPFHASLAEASAGASRKLRNLQFNRGQAPRPFARPAQLAKAELNSAALNFGGQAAELWCEGGERQFLARMIAQSQGFASQCLWFTSLVSKQENLRPCYQALGKLAVDTIKTIEMHQGNKITRVLAWSFLSPSKRQQWRREFLGAK